MKKIISLISLLCLSAPIMGADPGQVTDTVQVLVAGDEAGQVTRGRDYTVVGIKPIENIAQLAERINRALAKFTNVYVPLRVEKIKQVGDDILLTVNKFQSSVEDPAAPEVAAPSSPVRPAVVHASVPFDLFVKVVNDRSGQIRPSYNLRVLDVDNNDNIEEFAEKINRAVAEVKGVNRPLTVWGIFYGGKNLLLGDNKRKLGTLGAGLGKESIVGIGLGDITIKGADE